MDMSQIMWDPGAAVFLLSAAKLMPQDASFHG